MDIKWKRVEEGDNLLIVIGVPILMKDSKALKRLVEGGVTYRMWLRSMRQAVAYLMEDASGLGGVLVVLSQSRLVLEAVEFTPLYQGRSSNFREGGNLTERIERSVEQGGLKNVDLVVFTKDLVFESVFYKGTSNRPLLFEIVLCLHQVQMEGELIFHIVHIA